MFEGCFRDAAVLELVKQEETLESAYSHHTFGQLGEAAHKHASHSLRKNVEVGRNDEDLVDGELVAEHEHGDESTVKRHPSREEIEGHVDAADVRALGHYS